MLSVDIIWQSNKRQAATKRSQHFKSSIGIRSLNTIADIIVVHVCHWSAVNPENELPILLGILPTSIGNEIIAVFS